MQQHRGVVVWEQNDGSPTVTNQVFMSEAFDGIWTHPETLDDFVNPIGSEADSASIISAANGDMILTWNQLDGTTACDGDPCRQLFKAEYRSDVWTYPSDLGDFVSLPGMSASGAKTSLGFSGETVMAWIWGEGNQFDMFVAHNVSGSWVYPADSSDYVNPSAEMALPVEPLVASGIAGQFFVSWDQLGPFLSTPLNMYVCIRKYGDWICPSDFDDTFWSNPAAGIKLQANRNNDALLLFSSYDGLQHRIFASFFR